MSENGFSGKKKQALEIKIKKDEGPFRNPYLLFYHNQSPVKYTVQPGTELMTDTPTHYRHQLFISALKPTSPLCWRDKHGRHSRSRSPSLLRYLTARRKRAGWRRSRRAEEGASAISPSLPVFNSLMKFRSEEQWCKHSRTVVAILTCLSVCLSFSGGLSQHFFVYLPA